VDSAEFARLMELVEDIAAEFVNIVNMRFISKGWNPMIPFQVTGENGTLIESLKCI
jgi:hypothetical protein